MGFGCDVDLDYGAMVRWLSWKIEIKLEEKIVRVEWIFFLILKQLGWTSSRFIKHFFLLVQVLVNLFLLFFVILVKLYSWLSLGMDLGFKARGDRSIWGKNCLKFLLYYLCLLIFVTHPWPQTPGYLPTTGIMNFFEHSKLTLPYHW